jgi:transcription elongation factor Elf1
MPKHAHNNTGTPLKFHCPFCGAATPAHTLRVTETVHKKHRWIIGCPCGCRYVVEILEGPRV